LGTAIPPENFVVNRNQPYRRRPLTRHAWFWNLWTYHAIPGNLAAGKRAMKLALCALFTAVKPCCDKVWQGMEQLRKRLQ
jgi:hypothetical protein